MQQISSFRVTRAAALSLLFTLAAAFEPVRAQVVSPTDPEFDLAGRFTTDGPDNIPQNVDDTVSSPLASVNISGVGYISGGDIFLPGPVPGYPFSPVFRVGVPSDETGANYSFVFDAGPGVVTDPFSGPSDTSVITQYSFGTLNIFRVPSAPGVLTNNNFGSGTPANRATFTDGSLYLSMNITSLTFSQNPVAGTGTLAGAVAFTGGELFFGYLSATGQLTGTFNTSVSIFDPNTFQSLGTYDYITRDGRADVGATTAAAAPEPATLALLAAGLLPVVSAVIRRRREE